MPRRNRLENDLRRMSADAIAFSVMVGAGETYLAAFVLAMGKGELAAGLVASIPMLAGAVIQLISPAAVRWLRSHRRWVVLCAIVQALSFIPLIVGALLGALPTALIFLFAAVYWGSGMATGPAWNTWAGTIVPQSIRAAYFAKRSRMAHIAVLIGLLGGGASLHLSAQADSALTAFAMLFLVAAMCRTVSAVLLAGQSEPDPPDENHRQVPWRELAGRFRHSHGGRLLLYMLVVQAAVQISGPYFTPFMLGELEMSYANYLLLIATSYSARILVMPLLGQFIRRAGARRVLWFAGLGIVPLSALWLGSDEIWYLFLVQLVAGAVWAAYELATFLLLFETIAEEERTSVLTTFNLGNALAIVGGSTLGGAVLSTMGSDHAAYMAIFAISGGVRLLTIPLLGRAARDLPEPSAPIEPVPTRVVAVRPNLGSIERPVLPGLPSPPPPPAEPVSRAKPDGVHKAQARLAQPNTESTPVGSGR